MMFELSPYLENGMRYYFVRVYDDDGKPLCTRCEKAAGPREACMKAFGVIYDQPYNTCRYKDIGTRIPRSLTQKRLKELEGPENWLRIPSTGK